jgi:NADPH:quinone reductase-like Zn-dependent oxidoreductase
MLKRARLQAGDTLLVVGIGGGVASAALALGKAVGAHVSVTSRDPMKRDRALELGADAAFDSVDAKWPIAADVVVESVGPATWDQSVRALKSGGRLVLCGGTSGSSVELNLPRLFFKQIEIIGSTMGSYQEFAEVTDLVANGLPVVVDEIYPLTDYLDALARLEGGSQLGKIVLSH